MSEKPQQIGECQCPIEGCAVRVALFKYRERSARGSMFKGKLYGRCPTHGRVIDASNPTSQEYVLNQEGAIWGANQTKPAQQPAQKPVEPTSELAPKPVQKPPAAPVAQPTARPLGWNLWDWWPIRRRS